MRGHVRKRGARWQAIVHGGYDPISGRRRTLSATAATEKEAWAKARALIRQAERGRNPATKATFKQLFDEWVDIEGAKWSPTTRARNRIVIAKQLGGLADVEIRKVTTHDIARLYAKLGRQGLTPASVMRVHSVLHRALQVAVRWEWLDENPASNAVPTLGEVDETEAPEVHEVRRLLDAAEHGYLRQRPGKAPVAIPANPTQACFLRVAAATGAREGELCGLRWSAVDLDAGEVSILLGVVRGDDGKPLAKAPKTKRSKRVLSIDPGTIDALRRHRARQAENALACGVGLEPEAYVFSFDAAGRTPWRPDGAGLRFRRLRDDLGLHHVKFHGLRKFSVSQLMDAQLPVANVSKRHGHSRISTTTDHYTKAVDARDLDAARIMGRVLDGPDQPEASEAG